MAYITLKKENNESEHICRAFPDKKCGESYKLKNSGLKGNLPFKAIELKKIEQAQAASTPAAILSFLGTVRL